MEFRVCRELDGIPACQKLGLWCDGFIPQTYKVTRRKPHVHGTVWIGIGPLDQEEWEFTLLLGQACDCPEQIPWAELLPPENRTKWLTVDLEKKQLVIEPRRAIRESP